MKSLVACVVICLAALLLISPAQGGVYNIKVVTDASPDYTDMQSLIHSVTDKWQTTPEKLYAMYWWNHIVRRQCNPICLHGLELTDPIRQFNDYGYTMCSTIAGVNNAIWTNMGFEVKFWDIANHTVPEVFYDGKWHMYDDSMGVICTTCDGKSVAGVNEIAAEGACEASGGKKERYHLALYHNMFVTMPGKDGTLTGNEGGRGALGYAVCYRGLCDQWYLKYFDWGHRYMLNIRPNEAYTRYYARLDGKQPFGDTGGEHWTHDQKYYVIVPVEKGGDPRGDDPEWSARVDHIRDNGVWEYQPALTAADMKEYHSLSNIALAGSAGLQPGKAGAVAEAVFKVNSANVATSQEIEAKFSRKSADDQAAILVSTDNGRTWAQKWTASATGEVAAKVDLLREVNGSYEILVKIQMTAKSSPQDIVLKSLHIRTITEVNGKAMPRLNIGKNVVYFGAGEQTDATVIWPDLQGEAYKSLITDSANIKAEAHHSAYSPVIYPADMEKEGYLVYRLSAPADIVKVNFGGRYKNMEDSDKGKIALLYSLDEGKSWTEAWSLTGKGCPQAKGKYGSPTDEFHYQMVDIPAGNKSVLVKYSMNRFGLFALRAEAQYKPGDTTFKPMVVTFAWNERQDDYSVVKRSHSQLVDKLPFKYEINVGGVDHPEMVSLAVCQKDSAATATTQPVKYGYSDGNENKDARKYVGNWVTYGKNLAVGKKYTVDMPCETSKGFDMKTGLTDGLCTTGGPWDGPNMIVHNDQRPTIDLDLGEVKEFASIGMNLHDTEAFDGTLAKQDKIEVLISEDNKDFKSLGLIDLKPRYKDIPYNYMLNDRETSLAGFCKFYVTPEKPVRARYVRYKILQIKSNWFTADELVVLESVKNTPFDIRITLPDEAGAAKK